MRKLGFLLPLGLAAGLWAQQPAQPVVVVNQFTAKAGVGWPYDFTLLQKSIEAAIQKKMKSAVAVADTPPSGPAYTLDGQVTRIFDENSIDNHSGGVASNTQIITVHYWMTDGAGKKVFDKTSTYDAVSAGINNSSTSYGPGPMAKDLASDIASRVRGALK